MSRPNYEDSVAGETEESFTDVFPIAGETEESLTDVFPDASYESDGDILYHKQKNIYLTGNNNTILTSELDSCHLQRLRLEFLNGSYCTHVFISFSNIDGYYL